MKAMVLSAAHRPLLEERPDLPHPTARQVQLRVQACGVCRTDLHIVDGEEFLAIAAEMPLRTATVPFSLADANKALTRLRDGNIEGAAVLVPAHA